MRKNSIRKLIHGILDLLPLFVIPIFAININQKSVEPISIEVQENIQVNYNQLVKFNENEVSKYHYVNTYTIEWDTEQVLTGYTQLLSITNVNRDDVFLTSYYFENSGTGNLYYYRWVNGGDGFSQMAKSELIQYTSSYTSPFAIYVVNNPNSTFNGSLKINIVNLTYMFGSGNEPSINEFNLWYPNIFYDYTYLSKQLIEDVTTTYDDTDIGSQFLYSLYISTDNYFNMNNVFNLNGVYSWFEMNIFGGSAPLSIYIVWNIIIYELVMDLLMLLYALFMFFIDACQKLIDKPLESIK